MIAESDAFQIRYLDPRDEKTLRKWLADPAVRQYLPCETEAEIDGQLRVWMGYSRYKCGLLATYKDKPCGAAILFLMPYQKVAHHSMASLIVPPAFRGKGVATALVRNLIHLGKTYFKLERIDFELLGRSTLVTILENEGCRRLFTQDDYIQIDGAFRPRILLEKSCN